MASRRVIDDVDSCAPRRVVPGEDATRVCENQAGTRRLTIRLSPSDGDSGLPAGAEAPLGTTEIVAAPAEMWRETPVSLLPRWLADSKALVLTRTRERWRVQALGEDQLSELRDVPADEDAVELALGPAADVPVQVTADRSPLFGARPSLVRPGASQTGGRGSTLRPMGALPLPEAGSWPAARRTT